MTQPKTRREMEIWSACDGLWAQNGSLSSITGDAIREEVLRLGFKKGSPNEIYRYRKTWIDARQLGQLGDSSQDLVAPDPISRAVHMVHEQLKKDSEDVIAALQADFDESQKRAAAEISSLQTSLTSFQAECAALKSCQKTLEQHNEDLELQVNTSQANERLSSERLGAFQSLFDLWRADAAEKHAQMETLFGQVLSEKDAALVMVKKEAKALGEKYCDEINTLKVQVKNLLQERDGLLERQTKSLEKQKTLEKELRERSDQLKESSEGRAALILKEQGLATHLAMVSARSKSMEDECERLLNLLHARSRSEGARGDALKGLQRDILKVKKLIAAKGRIKPLKRERPSIVPAHSPA